MVLDMYVAAPEMKAKLMILAANQYAKEWFGDPIQIRIIVSSQYIREVARSYAKFGKESNPFNLSFQRGDGIVLLNFVAVAVVDPQTGFLVIRLF